MQGLGNKENFINNFINKETLAQVFSCKLCEIFKNTFFTEHLCTTASTRSQMNGKKNLFSSKLVTSEEILKTIYSLKSNKVSLSYTTPVKIVKMFSGSFLPNFTGVINHSIATSSFPDELKLAEVMSAFKKDDPLDKENYRPISLLSHTSILFEKILSNQINNFIRPYFSDLGEITRHNTA